MKKRLLAIGLALALLLGCLPVGAMAEGTEQALLQEQETTAAAEATAHDHPATSLCAHCDQQVTWIPWGDTAAEETSLPNDSRHYYLVCDITVDKRTNVSGSADLVLCLNGYTIDAQKKDYIYQVGTNNSTTDKTKVTIFDCGAGVDSEGVYRQGAMINGKGKDGGGAFFLRGASSLYMYGGKLAGHQNTQTASGWGGGAIASRNTATIHLENVTIENCTTSQQGGAIGARDSVNITLKNVTFKDNSATTGGGAVALNSASNTLIATGCSFDGNTTDASGGAIGLFAGEATVTDCIFQNNHANENGGAAYAAADSEFAVLGGSFVSNTATGKGGAIGSYGATVSITGNSAEAPAVFQNNGADAKENGGAIFGNNNSRLTLQYTLLTGNRIGSTGGSALMITGGANATVADTQITGNGADADGTYRGAAYVAGTKSVLTLSGKVVIRDNRQADLFVQDNKYQRDNGDCWLFVQDLAEGSDIRLHTVSDPGAMTRQTLNTYIIDGQPESWKAGWILYHYLPVDYDQTADQFFIGASLHVHCACGAHWAEDESCDHEAHPGCDHAEITYQPWSDPTSLPTSGAIYLLTDVHLQEHVPLSGELKLCLNGYSIYAEYPEAGSTKDRIFTMNGQDKLTISDCKAHTDTEGNYVAGKLAGSSYTAVMVANKTGKDEEGNDIVNTVVIDFYDGIFTDNQSSAGAAFSIQDGATLNMYGGQISGNTSTKLGGAIYVGTHGNFYMHGGRICGNEAAGNGTVYVDNSVAAVYGGTITGNIALEGAGIYLKNTEMTIGGAPVIRDNTANGAASNVYLAGNMQLQVQTMEETAHVGIRAELNKLPRQVSANEAGLKGLVSDIANRPLELIDGYVYIGFARDHKHCLHGDDSGCGHTEYEWASWDDPTSLPTLGGYYYLTVDVTLSETAKLETGDLHLCLNGKTVTANGAEGTKADRIYSVSGDASLTISDCTAAYGKDGTYTAGKLTGATNTAIFVPNETGKNEDGTEIVNTCKINLYDGIITGNTITGTGAAMCIQDGGEFYMYGGQISGNEAKVATDSNGKTSGGNASAVYVGTAATFHMQGGQICGNTNQEQGTVYVTAGSVMNMYGGSITENTAQTNAAGVLVSGRDSAMNLQGGVIKGNAAGSSAGGVLVQVRATLTMAGGEINENTAKNGGGVYLSSYATMTMTGGEISGNTATNGAGLFLYGGSLTMQDGSICNNEAENGAGMYVRLGQRTVDGQKLTDVASVVTMEGGSITENRAAQVGGGVLTHGEGTTFTLTGGKITKNAATSGGGVIAQWNSDFLLQTGQISENTAKNGAGVYVSYTAGFRQLDGQIVGNKATGNGGGIYALGSEVTLCGGKISGNSAQSSGGAIYGNKYTRFTGTPQEITYTAKLLLAGVKVENNTAAGNGAGICTNNKAEVIMESGSVTGNRTPKAGGGMLLQSGSRLELRGGTVGYNSAKNGAGVYISTNSAIQMTGGSICYNTSTGNCAGLYLLKAEAVLAGGSVTGNTSDATGGGVYMAGSQVRLSGTNITDNVAKGNGAGVCTTKRTQSGVDYYTNIQMTGGTISGNQAGSSGGGILLQSYTTMTMSGGKVQNNSAIKDGGGIYVSTNCTFHMDGGAVDANTAERNGGGLYNLKATVNYNGGQIVGNQATGNGGGMVMSGEGYQVTMKEGILITQNTATNGGAIVVQGKITLNMENVALSGNKATGNGGAIYLSTNSFLNITGGSITDHSCEGYGGAIFSTTNSALHMTDTQISRNQAGFGGGLSLGGTVNAENILVSQNRALQNGGGIFCHKLLVGGLNQDPLITLKNSRIENNNAEESGGGVYVGRGSKCLFDGLTVTGNVSKAEGSGVYVVDDTTMLNMTVTGNTSENQGYALYLADSEYDGESYFVGIFKLGGVMQVKDNEGGDMYFGNQTAAAVDPAGLLEGTLIHVTLHSGYLTQVLQGVYHYEGGNLSYVVTAGDKSLTAPEYDPAYNDQFGTQEQATPDTEEEEQTPERKPISPVIWIAGGAGAVVIGALVAILAILSKKKKLGAKK